MFIVIYKYHIQISQKNSNKNSSAVGGLILPFFAIILPFYFPFSLFFPLSSFFFPLSSLFFYIFPLFLFTFLYFFPQMTSADIFSFPQGVGVFSNIPLCVYKVSQLVTPHAKEYSTCRLFNCRLFDRLHI